MIPNPTRYGNMPGHTFMVYYATLLDWFIKLHEMLVRYFNHVMETQHAVS
jgi:hypothetical protein